MAELRLAEIVAIYPTLREFSDAVTVAMFEKHGLRDRVFASVGKAKGNVPAWHYKPKVKDKIFDIFCAAASLKGHVHRVR